MRIAAPDIIRKFPLIQLEQPRSRRIEMDIRTHDHKVSLRVRIDQKGFVSPLEQVPVFVMPHIESLRIGALKPLHARDKIRLWCFNQDVIMVAHQNIAVNDPPRPTASLTQGIQEHFTICIILKDCRSTIATTHDMVNCTRVFNSWSSRHTLNFYSQNSEVSRPNTNIRGLTPLHPIQNLRRGAWLFLPMENIWS